MSETDCIFCKIVAGELPGEILDEDEKTVSFMDINPANPGHALERVDVGTTGEQLALGAPDERPRIRRFDLVDAGDQRHPRLVAEQVERRVVEDQHRDRPVTLDSDRLISHRRP